MTVLSTACSNFTKTYVHNLVAKGRSDKEFIWNIELTHPFDELILSWNGFRPHQGKWVFWVRVRQNIWSPWIKYAEWTAHSQKTFKYAPQGSFIEGYQDAIFPKDGQCDGAQVKVLAEEGASLHALDTLYACLSSLSRYSPTFPKSLCSVLLPKIALRSQMKLDHPRARDLCSPTATTNAMNCLNKHRKSDPIAFAAKVHDHEFDIYGNWILNTAQAYEELEGQFRCHVERIPHLAALHSYLMQNLPVVISVRGPLPGSFSPITFGHLICVVGYNADTQKVICVDSGFEEDDRTLVGYDINHLVTAWGRRHNIAYIFTPKD